MSRSILFALTLSLFTTFPVLAANNIGIGAVDMQQVLEQSKLGKRLQEQLRQEFEPQARKFAEEEKEIHALQQAFERDKALMSKDQAAKQEKELVGRIEAYQKKVQPLQQELAKAQQIKGREIVAPAREAVNTVAKKKKLSMVVERGLAGMLYLDSTLDITADVIEELNSRAK
ncbi:OmpH family outer membrane protein [Chromatium okenii]|uniref:OmpH family outer membrane protein n=1 Tax=Chromatium okenii TaxID=61644 RepID=UPI0026EE83A0|nr:OmpH family outer membrane protein [Chromatium okenii]MBV5310629.1 OmpH family outer membrane protein [Chromatium okenii]